MKHSRGSHVARSLVALALLLSITGCSQQPTQIAALTFMKGNWACAVTIPPVGQSGGPPQTLKATIAITADSVRLAYAGTQAQPGTTRDYSLAVKGDVLTSRPSDGSDGGWVVTLPQSVHFDASNTVHVKQQSSGWDADVPVNATALKVTFSFAYPGYSKKISYSCTPDHGNH